MLPILIAAVILVAAAAILVHRAISFFKTRGQSACERCPYSGACSKRGTVHSCINS